MTEEQKKAVTKWLGECWHEKPVDRLYYPSCYCKLCGNYIDDWAYLERERRTFADPADFFAVWEKLVEKGVLSDICEKSPMALPRNWYIADNQPVQYYSADFIQWLLSQNPDGTYKLCGLVAEWIGKQQP